MDTDPRLIRGFQIVAGIIALLVLVQAALAGQFFNSDEPGLRDAHKGFGYLLFMLAIVQLALAWLTRDAWRYKMVIWSGLVLLLIVTQIGLGDNIDKNDNYAAIHIPIGVFLFGLSSIVAMLAMMDERAKSVLSGDS